MNKLFTFLASAALVGSFTACSSDEPAKGSDQGTENGSNFYLAIKISDANSLSRAGEGEGVPSTPIVNEGDFAMSTTENEVEDVHFYFFDKKGVFMTEASVWGDKEGSTETPNVEIERESVLVLRNLKKDELPAYLITVINAPADFIAKASSKTDYYKTMDDMHKETMDIFRNPSAESKRFVMSTTSFYDNEDIYNGNYDVTYPYANKLKDTYFLKEVPKEGDLTDDNTVKIYVERLAAKYSLTSTEEYFKVETTVGGENNDMTGDDSTPYPSGDVDIYVKIDKFDVAGVEKESYLSKHINLWKETAPTAGWNWNDALNHRSYWAESVNYVSLAANYPEENPLTGKLYNDFTGVASDGKFAPVYSNETTNSLAALQGTNNSLRGSRTPNFIIIATSYTKNADGEYTPIELIQEGSLYYTQDRYIARTLDRLKGLTGLNFYKFTGKTSEDKNDYNNYEQVDVTDVAIQRYGNDNSKIELIPTTGVTELYQKQDDGKFKPTTTESFKTELNSLFLNGNQPTMSTSGKMYYSIAVEHLLGTNADNTERKITKEGEYGVVRNHWYQLEISKISHLGTGLYEPDKSKEPITPKDEEPATYAMGARIKILSWKIVKQTVDL